MSISRGVGQHGEGYQGSLHQAGEIRLWDKNNRRNGERPLPSECATEADTEWNMVKENIVTYQDNINQPNNQVVKADMTSTVENLLLYPLLIYSSMKI